MAQAHNEDLLRRYEHLKRLLFSVGMGRQYDEDGQEIPSVIDRSQLFQMFENMGVEVPLRPEDPPKFLPRPRT